MIMASDNDREKAGLAIILGQPEGGESPMGGEEERELALDTAVEEIMLGVQDQDPTLVKQALRSFVEIATAP